jgi:hypothetical protein
MRALPMSALVGFVSLAGGVLAVACSVGSLGVVLPVPAVADAGAEGGETGNLVGNGDASGHPCVRLECQQVECADRGLPPTTVSGVVLDPAGQNPLYDVIVYVPNAPVQPFVSRAWCATSAASSPAVRPWSPR